MLWLLILAVGLVAWGAARGGVPLALMAAVAARLLLARADAVRWVQPAFPGGALPALPGDPASLLDPAYFATPALGGGLASSADAVLTALLAAGAAVLIARRLARAGPADAVATGTPRPAGPWRAVAWGLLAAGGLLLLRALGHHRGGKRQPPAHRVEGPVPVAELLGAAPGAPARRRGAV